MTAFRTLLLQSKLLCLFVRQRGYKSVDPLPRKCADLVNQPVISTRTSDDRDATGSRFGNGVVGRFQEKEFSLLLTGLRSKSPVRPNEAILQHAACVGDQQYQMSA